MARFVVDSRSLLVVRDTLGRLHLQLLAIPNVVDGYDGVLGGHALEDELEQFTTSWQFAITQVAGQIDAIMGWLLAAAAAYERIERRIAGAGHNHPSQTGSGTTTIGGPPPAGSGTTTMGGPPAKGSRTTVIG